MFLVRIVIFSEFQFFCCSQRCDYRHLGQHRSKLDCNYLFFSEYLVTLWCASWNTGAGGNVVPVNRCSTDSCAQKTQLFWRRTSVEFLIQFHSVYSQPFLQDLFILDASGANDSWSANWVVSTTGAYCARLTCAGLCACSATIATVGIITDGLRNYLLSSNFEYLLTPNVVMSIQFTSCNNDLKHPIWE